MSEEETEDFGPCCGCERPNDKTVRTIVMMDIEAPEGFVGWGCVVCKLPNRGAIAILCDDCMSKSALPKFICTGVWVTERKRQALDDTFVIRAFMHDDSRHVGVDIFMTGDPEQDHDGGINGAAN